MIIRKNTSATYLAVGKSEVGEIRIVKNFISVLSNNYFFYPEKRKESKLKKDCEQMCCILNTIFEKFRALLIAKTLRDSCA